MSRDRSRTAYDRDADARADDLPPYEDDRSTDETDDRSTLGSFVPFGWPTVFDRGESEPYGEGYDDAYGDERYGGDYGDEYRGEDEGTWLDEGLITLLVVVGAVLFLVPEPATSGLGILLLTVGVLAWIADWAT